ncbi:hypothetical protein BDW62DRAFT_152026 [Aspergillus aurantiobrunneus]
MSADQLLYPMDFSSRQDEWLDFDNLFQLPSDYLDTSVESISPRDLDPSFTDMGFLNWDSDPAMCSQAMFPDFMGYETPVEGLEQSSLDFINPNDVLQPLPQDQFVDPGFDSTWLPDVPNLGYSPSFRHMVESQAALDTRCFSQKEKRRDASIALHLQRTQNAPLPKATPCERSSSKSQNSSPPAPGSEPGASMQLVLDLNMNTTTHAPKKQKPRTRAQRENYIKARKYGVCEKHRKQHKRCNCLEKAAASHLNASASCAGTNTIAGLQTNHESLLVNTSRQRSVQNPTSSANAGPLRPTRQPVRAPMSDLSPTQPLASAGRDQVTVRQPTNVLKPNVLRTEPVQPSVSPTSHDRATAHSTHLLVTGGGSLSKFALYRDRDGQNTQHFRLRLVDERSRQTLRHSVDAQPASGSRISPTLQQLRVADTSLAERAVTIARTTAGLLSFWQGSRTVSSWAGCFLGRLAVFSSRLYMQTRKGIGLF